MTVSIAKSFKQNLIFRLFLKRFALSKTWKKFKSRFSNKKNNVKFYPFPQTASIHLHTFIKNLRFTMLSHHPTIFFHSLPPTAIETVMHVLTFLYQFTNLSLMYESSKGVLVINLLAQTLKSTICVDKTFPCRKG